jgi:methylglutaconyl-CoA hydratase
MVSGPVALARVKTLFDRAPQLSWDEARDFTTQMIAELRCGQEGQEGMRAFLERRKPAWSAAQEDAK